ncbi:Toxin HigB-2 [Rubripirellula obstinata]|uniref:Toxin HigB-2 n=1 Tax=Rubripirellula obstinata TaxID=406547 RepID=A0A5B1CFW6_9BACT|nr:type II toxin-antitoxin system RelE/ParE family toxin [Rubripirellula obstinata]KAA1258629.1 Toxin HigB-2 [Rubripirellula obstinata]
MDGDELLYFVYLDEFQDDWKSIYSDDSDELSLWALEMLIMSDPEGPPIVAGTGGLRKVRFAIAESDQGKSGGVRVCYAYFAEYHIILMMMAYPKNRKDNLSANDKAGIKKYLAITEKWLEQKSRRKPRG